MPTIDANTAREEYTIAGKTFSIAQPYAAGHTLSKNEANALNQTYAENIRNNFAKTVKAAVEADTFDDAAMQTALDEYMGKYEFGTRVASGPRTSGDPVKARAIDLARELVKAAIRKAGGNLKDYSGSEITDRAKKAVEANPKIVDMARTQIEQEAALGDLGGVLDSAAPTVEKAKRKSKAEPETAEA